MAGKFVSIEEAARLLGASVDEVNRLVDRKKLFPMRDGATLKFKVDDIDRLVAELGDEVSPTDALSLADDLPTPGDDLALGDVIDLGAAPGGGGADVGSQTAIRGGASDAVAGGASGLALGGGSGLVLDGGSASDRIDLELDSVVSASSPSLPGPAAPGGSSPGSFLDSDEPVTIDLSSHAVGGGSGMPPGSQATGSIPGLSGPRGSGSGFAVPADSGLSLEEGVLASSGIDLDVGPAGATPAEVSDIGGSLAGGSLGGGSLGGGSLGGGLLGDDTFELGHETRDEESASVVIETEESGDSSFFTAAGDDSASMSFGDSVGLDSAAALPEDQFREPVEENEFNVWQLTGLICCSVLLLVGAFIMYDLAWTIRSPQATPLTAPLLNALSDTFGWRR